MKNMKQKNYQKMSGGGVTFSALKGYNFLVQLVTGNIAKVCES